MERMGVLHWNLKIFSFGKVVQSPSPFAQSPARSKGGGIILPNFCYSSVVFGLIQEVPITVQPRLHMNSPVAGMRVNRTDFLDAGIGLQSQAPRNSEGGALRRPNRLLLLQVMERCIGDAAFFNGVFPRLPAYEQSNLPIRNFRLPFGTISSS